MPLAKVVQEQPDVFNHNIETVPRLYPVERRGNQFLSSTGAADGKGDERARDGEQVGPDGRPGRELEEMTETMSDLREDATR